MNGTTWGLGFALAFAVSTTAAAAENGFDRRGWYVGGGPLYVQDTFKGDAGRLREEGSLGGVRMLGGYRTHPHFATEADLDIATRGTVTAVATTVAEKGYLTTGRVQPYGVAAVGAVYARADRLYGSGHEEETAALARFGGGIDVYATPHVVVNFEAAYALPTGDLSDFTTVPMTIGAQYRF